MFPFQKKDSLKESVGVSHSELREYSVLLIAGRENAFSRDLSLPSSPEAFQIEELAEERLRRPEVGEGQGRPRPSRRSASYRHSRWLLTCVMGNGYVMPGVRPCQFVRAAGRWLPTFTAESSRPHSVRSPRPFGRKAWSSVAIHDWRCAGPFPAILRS
jgi:hypothetical protein